MVSAAIPTVNQNAKTLSPVRRAVDGSASCLEARDPTMLLAIIPTTIMVAQRGARNQGLSSEKSDARFAIAKSARNPMALSAPQMRKMDVVPARYMEVCAWLMVLCMVLMDASGERLVWLVMERFLWCGERCFVLYCKIVCIANLF